jgi:Family of unknown function (DUF6152)
MGSGLKLFIAAYTAVLAAVPALGHHAFTAEFDDKQPMKMTGTVTKIEWQNPHTWFYIDVKDGSGKVANWGMEMGSPNMLIRSGWTRNSLKIGDVVSVEGFRAKDGSNNANAWVVVLSSTGQRLFAGSSKGQPTQ